MINTLLGTAIDPRKRQFKLGNIMGGLSGPAIKPVALGMILQTAAAIDIPIIGMGGISKGSEVAEFFLAGACAVQIGCASFADPAALKRIRLELLDFCREENIDQLESLRGQLVGQYKTKRK
jgi:dihydroorotate dehydrogenase (NAD+) catalytic subunit